MFVFSKKEYPNWYRLVELGSVFHSEPADNVCDLWYRTTLGVLFSVCIAMTGAIMVLIVIEFPIAYGFKTGMSMSHDLILVFSILLWIAIILCVLYLVAVACLVVVTSMLIVCVKATQHLSQMVAPHLRDAYNKSTAVNKFKKRFCVKIKFEESFK